LRKASAGNWGGDEIPWRPSGSAKARSTSTLRQRGASFQEQSRKSLEDPHRQHGEQAATRGTQPMRISFFARISRGRLVGKEACLSLPPDLPQGEDGTAL